MQYAHRIEVLMIFESRGCLKLYEVSRSLSIASKESQDLSNAPKALIEILTSLASLRMLITSRLFQSRQSILVYRRSYFLYSTK